MSNLALVTDNMLPVANETFIDNLSAGISAGAAIVPINSLAEYSDGDSVVLTVDPGTASQATFIGEKQGNTVIDCKWTEGNVGASHSAGATVIDYDSATHYNVVTKVLRMFANENGSLKTQPIRDALALGATSANGWEVLPNAVTVTSGYNAKRRFFDIDVANVDLRTILSKGMRMRFDRTVAAPTQSANFVAASTQYASNAAPSAALNIGTTMSLEAIVAPNQHNTQRTIMNRTDSGGSNGWKFGITGTGFMYFHYLTGSTNHYWTAVERINLKRKTHVAVTFSAGTVQFYYDGEPVASSDSVNTGAHTIGNSGIFRIGASATTTPAELFDGLGMEFRMWNTARTALQVRDNMYTQLAGNESGLVGYWKFNGNFNDSTTNGNNLTASGSLVATYADHLFKSTEYAVVRDVTYTAPNSKIRVFTGDENSLPLTALSAPYYSVQRAPYNFPIGMQNTLKYRDANGWTVYDNGSHKQWHKEVYFPAFNYSTTTRQQQNFSYPEGYGDGAQMDRQATWDGDYGGHFSCSLQGGSVYVSSMYTGGPLLGVGWVNVLFTEIA